MVTFAQLVYPILLAAFCVFVMSSLIHMVFKWHNSDYRALSNEEEVRAAIRKGNPGPGQYVLPYCADMKQMNDPAMQKKFAEGPNGFLLLKLPGMQKMGPMLGQWFLYCVLISFFAAYVASRTVAPGTPYLEVFRVAGTAAFLGYAGGAIPGGIWRAMPWSAVAKEILDGLIYALLTGGSFGALWPH
jgi:hypothetical protein